ncbi:MAG TPA: response regulator [Nitrososphaeraceae archaeon]|nr:response regulator [Nitrososphaeraceae archaeon]HZB63717.1 response regulator [Nitrososphaeraceae archaeon]
MKNILIVDDDVNTSLKYKKWLEDEGFNLTLINDPSLAELNFKSDNYDLILIGFKMSVIDGFNLYNKINEISKKVEHTPKEFRVCFMTSSVVNYKVLAEIHPEIGQECYVSKEVPKEVFIKHVYSLIS